MDPLLVGHPIYVATKEFQRRKHHKKRINKKWLKRYGCREVNLMEHGKVVLTEDGLLYMTKKTFEILKNGVENNESKKIKRNIESV